jgi:hypothetical protein
MNLTFEQQKLIDSLAEDFVSLVEQIEARSETTQNHYGDYGVALNRLSGGDKGKAGIIALALVKAGANRDGVLNGYKLFV